MTPLVGRPAYIAAFMVIVCLSLLIGCGGDNKGDGPVLPSGLYSPYPDNGSDSVPAVARVSWAYDDTTAATVYYDIYVGKTSPPPLYAAGITDTFATIGPLFMNTLYYWKVFAYTNAGDTTASPTWRFTTASSFTFPTAMGNQWQYSRMWIFDDKEPGESIVRDTLWGTSTVTIAGPAILSDTVETIAVFTSWLETPSGPGSTTDFWLDRADGLYLYAYGGPWIGPPKKQIESTVYYEIKGHRFDNLDDLYSAIRTGMIGRPDKVANDTTIESPPVRELAYPLEVGNQWMYRDTDLGHVWDMEKEIVGMDTVMMPCGTFECYIIHYLWDMDDDGVWDDDVNGYDWLSGGGIILRTFDYPPVTITDEFGDSLGVMESYDEYQLTDYELH